MTLARNLADLGNQVDSSGTLGIGGGGTSATNATAGFNALAPSQTSNTNKYLTTNGTNTSWAEVVSGMTVTALSYSGDDQAVDPSNPLPCTLTGTNFVAGSIVYVNTISAANSGTSINVTSSTSITFTPPSGLSAASYNVWIVSPTGTIAILANGILYSGAPSWAGQSTSLGSGGDVSIQLTATGDTPLTYSLVSGTLPTGTTLSSSGLISGTATVQGTFPNIVVKATDPESQDASITIEITITLGDAYFPYVTMLLHGDGANGAQNNTFVDSSTNNFTITRNGNTTQGSFSPYGSNWSNYFDGSSYLSLPSNAVFSYGTGDFTIEFWLYWSGADNQCVFATGNLNASNSLQIYTEGAGTTNMQLIAQFSGSPEYQAVTGTFTKNKWNHCALVRSSGTSQWYINGVASGSSSSTPSNLTVTSAVKIGDMVLDSTPSQHYYLSNGYVSNFRSTKGGALYSGTFTPSITPLTNSVSSGTVGLLTCQSNRFIDNSSNAFSITVNGTPSIKRFSPFAPSSAYSTSTIGGSGYFYQSNDWLIFADNNAFPSGTIDFCYEAWVYLTSSSFGVVFGKGGSGIYEQIGVSYTGSAYQVYISDSSNNYIVNGSTFGSPKINQWHHIAIYRNGNNFYGSYNGVVSTLATSSNSVINNSGPFVIGSLSDATSPTGAPIKGYITDLRIVTNSSVYGGTNFTPPTSQLTAISGTQVLCNMNNGAIYDNAMMNNLQTVNNAQISTSVVKYGTGSLKFDGTGDSIVANSGQNCAFARGDFTIEMWIYFNSFTQYMNLTDFRSQGIDGYYPCIFITNSSGELGYYVNSVTVITSSSNLSTGNWYHIAVCRSGTSTKMFINGTQTGSTYTDTSNYLCGSDRPMIGTLGYLPNYSGSDLNGYIDDFRITKGYARYTANFTPPTAAFSNT